MRLVIGLGRSESGRQERELVVKSEQVLTLEEPIRYALDYNVLILSHEELHVAIPTSFNDACHSLVCDVSSHEHLGEISHN